VLVLYCYGEGSVPRHLWQVRILWVMVPVDSRHFPIPPLFDVLWVQPGENLYALLAAVTEGKRRSEVSLKEIFLQPNLGEGRKVSRTMIGMSRMVVRQAFRV